MHTPSRAAISARMRAIVQFGRLATGSSSNGVTTRNAVSLFTGAGPGAMLAFNAATPSRLKSLRHSRTVSSRTPNASAMCGLVHPDRVSRIARALSASPRSRDPARTARPDRCSSLAETRDLPLMPHLCESVAIANRTPIRWSSSRSLLRGDPVRIADLNGERCWHKQCPGRLREPTRAKTAMGSKPNWRLPRLDRLRFKPRCLGTWQWPTNTGRMFENGN